MQEHDAIIYLIHYLREPTSASHYPNYGYDVYIPNVLRGLLQMNKPGFINNDDVERAGAAESAFFYAAAWELCRRGILRPGVKRMGLQQTSDGSAGNGYSITPFGRRWLQEADRDDFVPTEPERFGGMLAKCAPRFGKGFQERGQEAVRCYGAHAYFACCAMSGAAAESILLATAIAKSSEDRVLRDYAGAAGRSRVEKMLVGQAVEPIRREFTGLTALMKYWRDQAAHGRASGIGDNEAYTSLAMLLRFAQFCDGHWTVLAK